MLKFLQEVAKLEQEEILKESEKMHRLELQFWKQYILIETCFWICYWCITILLVLFITFIAIY